MEIRMSEQLPKLPAGQEEFYNAAEFADKHAPHLAEHFIDQYQRDFLAGYNLRENTPSSTTYVQAGEGNSTGHVDRRTSNKLRVGIERTQDHQPTTGHNDTSSGTWYETRTGYTSTAEHEPGNAFASKIEALTPGVTVDRKVLNEKTGEVTQGTVTELTGKRAERAQQILLERATRLIGGKAIESVNKEIAGFKKEEVA